MKKTFALIAMTALMLTACDSNEGTAEPNPNPDVSSFHQYMIGEWDCTSVNDTRSAPAIKFYTNPETNNAEVERFNPVSPLSITDDTWAVTIDGQEYNGSYTLDGDKATISTPLGEQVITGIPASKEAAMNKTLVHVEGAPEDNKLYINVVDDRNFAISDQTGYETTCTRI